MLDRKKLGKMASRQIVGSLWQMELHIHPRLGPEDSEELWPGPGQCGPCCQETAVRVILIGQVW